ncbi:MAG: 30S ribosome-binding factor RbfA [Gemmatimonadota bacterium]
MARGGGASKRRPEQVGEVIRQVLAEALARGEVRDPRVSGLVTLTYVRVSPDLSHARVAVSVHGEDGGAERALEGLRSAAGFLRGHVAKALATRITPELHFELDEGAAHAARINAVLAELNRPEEAS